MGMLSLIVIVDVHGLCREPRATHGSFDGNIFGSCSQYGITCDWPCFFWVIRKITKEVIASIASGYQAFSTAISYLSARSEFCISNAESSWGLKDFLVALWGWRAAVATTSRWSEFAGGSAPLKTRMDLKNDLSLVRMWSSFFLVCPSLQIHQRLLFTKLL